MIDNDYEFQVLDASEVAAIRSIQKLIGAGNGAKGFHDEGREILGLPGFLAGAHPEPSSFLGRIVKKFVRLIPALERNYWMARISLIPTEASEALEELRTGRQINETYYSIKADGKVKTFSAEEAAGFVGITFKPEGVPSELVDGVVRTLDIADEADIDFVVELDRKLAYNATRERLHGKKA